MTDMTTQGVAGIVAESFNFGIVKLPLSGPDNLKTPLYGLFRDDTMELVNDSSVSKRYIPHQSDDVVALVDAASAAFDDDVRVRCHFNKGHYVTVSPSDEYRKTVHGTVDNVFPRLIIRAGYDGRAFKATIGLYRDMCLNLMMLDTVKKTSVSIRHSNDLPNHMDDLIKTFESLKGSWSNVEQAIDIMQGNRVNMVEFLNQIYGEPGDSKRAVTMHKNRTEAIFKRLQRECATYQMPLTNNFEVSGWLAYNAVQGYVQHDARRKSGTSPFDRMLLANASQEVKMAEKLALAV